MLKKYSEDCDYLRKKFELSETVNLYHLVGVATDFIRTIDDKEELVKLEETQISQEEPVKKETKRERSRK